MRRERSPRSGTARAAARLVPMMAAMAGAAWAGACGGESGGELEAIDAPASEQQIFDLKPRFTAIHQSYRAGDVRAYTPAVRATLRHARRLSPAQCVAYQAQLLDVGAQLALDGLESLWLVYQDCAAHGSQASVGAQRLANTKRLRDRMRFRAAPLAQLPLRVSHWNSALERGVYGEAARALVTAAAQADSGRAQGWDLHRLLREPSARAALCALPVRRDQRERIAASELIRVAGCATGANLNPQDACAEAFPEGGGGGRPPGLSDQDWSRLEELCGGMTATGSPGSAGLDDLDGYSTDACAGEDTTHLYESEEMVGLLMDCFFGGESNPLGIGGTSADIGRYMNQVLDYPINDGSHGAALVVGRDQDDPGRKFYGAYGATSQEALAALHSQIRADPPEGDQVSVGADGSTTITGQSTETNPDGTMSDLSAATRVGADGSVDHTDTTTHENGSGHHEQSSSRPDGSGNSTSLEWDENGNVQKKTETTTDANGVTTTTTTEYDYDDEGTITDTRTSTTTTQPGEEGGFDPKNPACQDLMAMEVMPGGSRTGFFDDLLGRPYWQDPRKVNPAPDMDTDTWGEEPFCGSPAIGSNTSPTRCNLPILCAAGYQLNDACQCIGAPAGTLPALGCITAQCAEGTLPVPLGPGGCSCQPAGSDDPGAPLPPLPDVALVTDVFNEMVWNRGDGQIFVTDGMLDGRDTMHPEK